MQRVNRVCLFLVKMATVATLSDGETISFHRVQR